MKISPCSKQYQRFVEEYTREPLVYDSNYPKPFLPNINENKDIVLLENKFNALLHYTRAQQEKIAKRELENLCKPCISKLRKCQECGSTLTAKSYNTKLHSSRRTEIDKDDYELKNKCTRDNFLGTDISQTKNPITNNLNRNNDCENNISPISKECIPNKMRSISNNPNSIILIKKFSFVFEDVEKSEREKRFCSKQYLEPTCFCSKQYLDPSKCIKRCPSVSCKQNSKKSIKQIYCRDNSITASDSNDSITASDSSGSITASDSSDSITASDSSDSITASDSSDASDSSNDDDDSIIDSYETRQLYPCETKKIYKCVDIIEHPLEIKSPCVSSTNSGYKMVVVDPCRENFKLMSQEFCLQEPSCDHDTMTNDLYSGTTNISICKDLEVIKQHERYNSPEDIENTKANRPEYIENIYLSEHINPTEDIKHNLNPKFFFYSCFGKIKHKTNKIK